MAHSFPFDHQYDSMDCGPACLKMVSSFHGRHYSLERLWQRCFISREGVSLLGISKAAEEIVFRTLGEKFTFEQWAQKAPLSCIVHWQQNRFNRFSCSFLKPKFFHSTFPFYSLRYPIPYHAIIDLNIIYLVIAKYL